MPFPSTIYFNPSPEFKQTWSLVPQVRTIAIGNQKTKPLYSSLSPAIPIFYILCLLAISFDIYIAVTVLAKQGVNIAYIIIAVILDLFLAVSPFLLELYAAKHLNHINLDNQIFLCNLKCQTKKKEETDDQFDTRKQGIVGGVLKQYLANKKWNRFCRFIIAISIFSIAFWKIYTFKGALPPGFSIFSIVKGKIVIAFSILCATFHLIGSEKAFAHFMFWVRKSEIKQHINLNPNPHRPNPTPVEIEYVGNYKNHSYGNTSVVNEDNKVYLKYIHVIRDEEIQDLINAQIDDNAKRGIAIKCKELQII